jgi:hypothetical protein
MSKVVHRRTGTTGKTRRTDAKPVRYRVTSGPTDAPIKTSKQQQDSLVVAVATSTVVLLFLSLALFLVPLFT